MICQSFERIHRSNLVGMGVLPLTFEDGTSWTSLGLKGDEKVTIRGLQGDLKPRQTLTAEIVSGDGALQRVPLLCRIDTLDETRVLPKRRHSALCAAQTGGLELFRF